jgi:heme/copper-type cytochrome/quinol oxidase subunit 4
MVALPIILITSLNFASAGFDDFQEQAVFNASLLLTTVAYLFITKDSTPETNEITMLDVITYTALLVSWALIIIRFLSLSEVSTEEFLEKRIAIGIFFVAVGIQSSLYLYLYVKYNLLIR